MTWDPPPAPVNDTGPLAFEQFSWGWTGPVDFWPFNNKPLDLTYAVPNWPPPRPMRVWLLFTPNAGSVWITGVARISMCSTPGNFCFLSGVYRNPGQHTFRWLGLDPSRALRTDITAIVLMGTSEASDGNIIYVSGSEPVISNLQATPALFRPGNGNLVFSFGASAFQSGTVSGTIVVERLDVAGALKTIVIPSQPGGALSLQWDGKSDGGILVAEGRYLVTVSLTDSLGSAATAQTIVTIAY